MIINQQESSVEQIGDIRDESVFKMKTSQKAFQILSSLYSDKPLAIVRELGCNAMDSHIASGQSHRPFMVHVPNTLEPWFSIKDFGTGISHENIYQIYTTYFESTKTDTNSQVGMLGLGSKSPFCYTDNFTITSNHNKVKRIYNAYFNKSGMPTIALASQNNTNEENGVEIQIPVKSSNFNDFSNAIFKSFRFFDVKPIITGGDITWNNDKADFEGSFWKSYSGLGSSYAIMGGVAYPIDLYKLSDDHYDIIRKAGLVINFNIGELDVTPSRESLMYHDWVITALNDKIELVKKDFVVKVEEKVKDADNLLDALKSLYFLNNQWSFLNSSLIQGKVMWKKIDITDVRRCIEPYAPSILNISRRMYGRRKFAESKYPDFNVNAIWYVDDLARGGHKRVLQKLKSNFELSINLVSAQDRDNLVNAGFNPTIFHKTSDLPPVQINRASIGKKNSKPKGVISLYEFGSHHHDRWVSESFDLSEDTAPKYYTIKGENWSVNAGTIKNESGEIIAEIKNKNTLRAFCNFYGICINNDLKMVSKRNAEILEKMGSKNIQSFFDSKVLEVDWEKVEIANHINDHTIDSVIKNKKFNTLPDNNEFKCFVLEMKQIIKDTKKNMEIRPHVSHVIRNNSKKGLTFPTKMVEVLYLACDTWQIGVEKVLDSLQ